MSDVSDTSKRFLLYGRCPSCRMVTEVDVVPCHTAGGEGFEREICVDRCGFWATPPRDLVQQALTTPTPDVLTRIIAVLEEAGFHDEEFCDGPDGLVAEVQGLVNTATTLGAFAQKHEDIHADLVVSRMAERERADLNAKAATELQVRLNVADDLLDRDLAELVKLRAALDWIAHSDDFHMDTARTKAREALAPPTPVEGEEA